MSETSSTAIYKCPCGNNMAMESWRTHDGPCRDDKYYCVDCLMNGKCGCLHPLTVSPPRAQEPQPA